MLGLQGGRARLRRRGRQGRGPGARRGGPGEIALGELAASARRARSIPRSFTPSASENKQQGFDPVVGQGASFPDYTYGTHAAEVEVDLETGEVEVLKYAACHDVGRAINPLRVEGQIQGGAMQGLGYALTEEIVLCEGKIASLAVRRLPRSQL